MSKLRKELKKNDHKLRAPSKIYASSLVSAQLSTVLLITQNGANYQKVIRDKVAHLNGAVLGENVLVGERRRILGDASVRPRPLVWGECGVGR